MAHGKQAMTDNMAGLLDSGLHANQDAGISHQYAADRSNLNQEEATKMANYDRQAANTNNSYQAALSAILDKYNGQKAAYVADMQNKDAERAFQAAQADKSAALQRELAQEQIAGAANAAQIQAASYNQPSGGEQLYNAITNAFNGFGARKAGYTESTILPQIKSLALKYGISPDDAQNIVYQYRKANYGS